MGADHPKAGASKAVAEAAPTVEPQTHLDEVASVMMRRSALAQQYELLLASELRQERQRSQLLTIRLDKATKLAAGLKDTAQTQAAEIVRLNAEVAELKAALPPAADPVPSIDDAA